MKPIYLAGAAATHRRNYGASQSYYFIRDQLSSIYNPLAPVSTAVSYWSREGASGGVKTAATVTENTIRYDLAPELNVNIGIDWKKVLLGVAAVGVLYYLANRQKMRRNRGGPKCPCKRKNPKSRKCACRKNRGSGTDYAKKYQDWHWGLPPAGVKDINDPLLPPKLIEIGRFMEFHLNPVGAKGKKIITFDEQDAKKNSHVAFDPKHPDERIYFVMSPKQRARMKKLWAQSNMRAIPLPQLAKQYGKGRHAKSGGYPNIPVKPLGHMSNIVYHTRKNGDDAKLVNGNPSGPGSLYIHAHGEEKKKDSALPIIAVDKSGRLHLAGGSYTCPDPGITD